MAGQPGAIRLGHLEQTVYFACQRRGVNLLSSMARKGALYRIGRGRKDGA